MRTEKELLELRANIKEQMRDLMERAKKEERDLSADELEQFERMDKDYEDFSRQIDVVRKFKQRLSEGGDNEAPSAPAQKLEYRDVFRKYLRSGFARLTAEEQDMLQTRAQSVGTDSAGGFTVPDELQNELIKQMKYYSGILEAGREMRTTDGRTIMWPYLNDTANMGAIIGENTADTELDLTFSQVSIGAYMATSRIIRASHEIITDSLLDLESEIFSAFAERLGRLFNNKLTVGTGTGEPEGFVTAAGVGVTAASATAITRDELVDLVHSVDRAYRNGPNVGFQFHDSTLAAIKKLSFGSGDDRPLWQPSVRVGEPDMLEGYPYWVNNDMATIATGAKTIAFGDFSKYRIRFAGNLVTVRLVERYAEFRQVGFNSFQRFDGKLLDANAIKLLQQA